MTLKSATAVFFDGDDLVLRGTPLELFNLIEDMDNDLREELDKGTNIDTLCRQMAGWELEEVYEIRIKLT
jgi:hypothetical protein